MDQTEYQDKEGRKGTLGQWALLACQGPKESGAPPGPKDKLVYQGSLAPQEQEAVSQFQRGYLGREGPQAPQGSMAQWESQDNQASLVFQETKVILDVKD